MAEDQSLPDKSSDDASSDIVSEPGGTDVASTDKVESAVRKLAEKKPEALMEVMAMGMTSVGNPLHQKMTGEHISQVLDLASKHDRRQYELHKKTAANDHLEWIIAHALGLVVFLGVVALVVVVLFLFREKPEVLVPTLTGVGGFVSGFAGGWGLGGRRK